MLKKSVVCLGMVCAVLLAAIPCMASGPMVLPPVTYSDGCQYVVDINKQANALIALITPIAGMLNTTLAIPPYDTMDLENGLTGDGIPDKFQLALLCSALCANADLQDQLNVNKAKFAQLIADLDAVVAILLGNGSTIPNAAVRLNAVADLLATLPATPELTPIIDQLRSAATTVGDLVAQIPGIITPGVVHQLLAAVGTYQGAIGALLGLSSRMQDTIRGLLTPDLLAQIANIRGQVVGVIASVRALATTPPFTAEQVATMNALAADAQTIVDALERTLALVQPGGLVVFGVSAKSAGEPFSALGDYDGDGNTNLATYKATGATIAGFVAAASGANPFWQDNNGDLVVTPIIDFDSAGPVGGPFAPDVKEYTLRNVGTAALTYSITQTTGAVGFRQQGGLGVLALECTLNAISQVTVEVYLIPEVVNSLSAGTHGDEVTFANVDNTQNVVTRAVTLTIGNVAGELQVTPPGDFDSAGPVGGPFVPDAKAYMLANIGASACVYSITRTTDVFGVRQLGGLGASMLEGTLNAFSQVMVEVYSVHDVVNGLSEGVYSDVVTFANVDNAEDVETRTVTLTISSGEGEGEGEGEFTWGDLSTAPDTLPAVACNGRPGGQDAALILKHYAGLITSLAECPSGTVFEDPAFPPGSDVNGDGRLGGQDAAQILKLYAGLIECFPADTNCDGNGPDAAP